MQPFAKQSFFLQAAAKVLSLFKQMGKAIYKEI